MIGRGKYKHVYLYEVTEQDLLLKNSMGPAYHLGNVLMFADKHNVDFGNEFACADDIDAAKEYLDAEGKVEGSTWGGEAQNDNSAAGNANLGAGRDTGGKTIAPTEHKAQGNGSTQGNNAPHGESIASLTQRIEQRDELLRDLSESLKAQREDNELLHAQLELTRKQLAVGELKHSELVDDLENVSKETHSISSTLERVMEEKFQLESELAEKITELVEVHLQNDDLRRQLEAPMLSTPRATATPIAPTELAPQLVQASAAAIIQPQQNLSPDTTVLTMSSGKQIHILHEFPQHSKPAGLSRAGRALLAFFRVAVVLLSLAVITCAAGIVTTASLNDVSYGKALDIILSGVGIFIIPA